MKPIEQGEELLKYLPQRPPFVMVTALFYYNNKKITAGLTINKDMLMLDDGCLNEGGVVESMAQTAALFAGVQAFKSSVPSAPMGYIASIKNLKINKLPFVGDSIVTKVEILNEVLNVQIASACVICDEVIMAECEMRIFIKPVEE